jgi:hypothetical protein
MAPWLLRRLHLGLAVVLSLFHALVQSEAAGDTILVTPGTTPNPFELTEGTKSGEGLLFAIASTMNSNLDAFIFEAKDDKRNESRLFEPPDCPLIATEEPSNSSKYRNNNHNRLECFLWNLNVAIPPQSFKKDFVTITVHDMVCTNIQLFGVETTYAKNEKKGSHDKFQHINKDAPEDDDVTSSRNAANLNVAIRQVWAVCNGKYHSTGGLSGDVQASVSGLQRGGDRGGNDGDQPTLEVVFSLYSSKSTTFSASDATLSSSLPSSSSYTSSSHTVRRPIRFRTTSCQLRLDVPWIHFSGSVSAKLIQLFAHTVSGYIVDALDGKICPLLARKLDPLVTTYLDRFNTFCDKYLPREKQLEQKQRQENGEDAEDETDAEPQFPQVTSTRLLVDDIDIFSSKPQSVADYSMVHSILTIFNQQLQGHLQEGWIPIPGGRSSILPLDCQDMFRGISGWWASLFGKFTHVILPPVFQHFFIPVPIVTKQNITLSINLSFVDIKGIDTMDTLQVMLPIREMDAGNSKPDNSSSSARVLRTKLESDQGFYIVAPVSLEIHISPTALLDELTPSPIPNSYGIAPLRESFEIKVNLTNIAVSVDTILDVVHWDDTSLLQVVSAVQTFVESLDVHDLGCLIQTLHDVRVATNQDADTAALLAQVVVSSIQLSRNKTDAPDGSLEADIDRAINTVVELALHEYKGLWGELIQGLAQGPGRRRLNKFIRDWIGSHSQPYPTDDGEDGHQHHCRTPDRSDTPKWVNFTKFELLDKLNLFFAHSHTKRTINHFLRCVGETVEAFAKNPSPAIEGGPGSAESSSFPFLESLSSPLSFLATLFGREVPVPHYDYPALFPFRDATWNTGQKIKLSKIETLNWDSLDQLQIMKPSGDTRLNSSLIFGHPNKVDADEIEFSTASPLSTVTRTGSTPPQITLTVDMDGPRVSGQVNVTVFASFKAKAEVQIDYDINRLENLTVSHLLDQADCGLLPAVEIRLLPGSTTVQFGSNLGVNLTAILNENSISLSTQEYPNLHEISNDMIDWSLAWMRNLFNIVIKEWMRLSVSRCPGVLFPAHDNHGGDGGGGNESASWKVSFWLWVVLVAFGLVQGGLVWVAQSSKIPQDLEYFPSMEMDDYHSYDESGACNTELESTFLSFYDELVNKFSGMVSRRQDEADVEINAARALDHSILNELLHEKMDDMYAPPHVILEDQLLPPISDLKCQIPLFATKRVPEFARYLIPTMILLTIILLISSNVSVGASVDLYLMVGKHLLPVPGLFMFSLGNTALDLYNAGIYPLLFLVVCFSGIWPYAKLLWMFHCWMTPNQDRYQRQRRLNMLDALGKFSLVDTYVLVVFVVAFRFHLQLSESLWIDVYVTPKYGFYSFLLATFFSLVVGHSILFFHRRDSRQQGTAVYSGSRESILEHGFRVEDDGPPKRLALLFHVLLIGGLIAALILLTVGFSQECFTFDFGGLAGLALGDDNNRTSYSVLSLGAAIPQSVSDSGSFGVYCLEGAYFFFTMIMPILCLFVILILMVCPMTVAWQQSFLVMAEITNAWSSVEVFLLSIAAALSQISTFASFMVGDRCEAIDRLAAEIFFDRDETVCFTVGATLQRSSLYLIIGALLNSFLVSICLRFAHAAIDERALLGEHDQYQPSPLMINQRDLLGCTLPYKLCKLPVIGSFVFVAVEAPADEFVQTYEAPLQQSDEDDESNELSSQ